MYSLKYAYTKLNKHKRLKSFIIRFIHICNCIVNARSPHILYALLPTYGLGQNSCFALWLELLIGFLYYICLVLQFCVCSAMLEMRGWSISTPYLLPQYTLCYPIYVLCRHLCPSKSTAPPSAFLIWRCVVRGSGEYPENISPKCDVRRINTKRKAQVLLSTNKPTLTNRQHTH